MAAHGPVPRVLLADKGYDSDNIRASLEAAGAVPMIPARRNRKNPVQIDDFVYGLRNRIERCFNKLRCSRRLATRYDKTADSYLGFIHLASIRLWFRYFVNRTYEYQRFLSDMAGSDFHAYGGRPDFLCRHVRDFLAKDCAPERALYGHKIIIEQMEAFQVKLVSSADADGLDIDNLQFVDYMHILKENDIFECAVKLGDRAS